MKSVIILTTILTVFFLSSCGGDQSDQLLGTWIASSYELVSCDDHDENESIKELSTVICDDEVDGDCYYSEITFHEDSYTYKNVITKHGETIIESGTGTKSLEEDKLVLCEDGMCFWFSYEISGSLLAMGGPFTDEGDGCVLFTEFIRK